MQDVADLQALVERERARPQPLAPSRPEAVARRARRGLARLRHRVSAAARPRP
jgi:hypothetical protein